MTKKLLNKAWIVTVDMGYGHQRASYPLHKIAQGGIISANNYIGIPETDKNLWSNSKKFYEAISRFKKVPYLGDKIFELYDRLQSIPMFYPRRDLSKPSMQVKQIYRLLKKNDWGKHLIDKLSKKPLPLVTTFFATAMMAEYHNYKGDIFCIATDADISRAWAPLEPHNTRINYLAPNRRVVERLKLYGVKSDKIFLTGFPLPEENIGKNSQILKADLGERLVHLDPQKKYTSQYRRTLIRHVGAKNIRRRSCHLLTITFAVGGAGAQRELGAVIIKSLKEKILAGEVAVNLVAGIHNHVNSFFKEAIASVGLTKKVGSGVNVLFERDKQKYFKKFNQMLRTTDVLWTKPSELSFYCALGIPIIMAPPIGSQEFFNRKWLRALGSGINQEDPRYVNEWFFDWLNSGWLAEAAMQGYLEAPKYGTYNVEKIIFNETKKMKEVKTVLQY